ncbi:hypothetical protein BS47DRAFT_1364501 [Hydnum rufescens UP504]|uniref:Uncharacterized protein n=1 Tax=Hydnum rufescens UP504 TaxID=1448309 RepID=A0A9P6DUD9_9AGAM|nr:hypothetical protein BS47DRAFT_1364501 [Hydnum rufescens UP504]
MSPRKYKHDDITADYNLLLDDVLASTSQADTAFGLNYDTTYSASERRGWAIDEVPETKGFHPSHCLTLLLENYSKNFDRSSEAVCRTAIDFILNECLTSMKANPASHGQTTREHSTAPPHPLRNIKAFGESFFLPYDHFHGPFPITILLLGR